MYPFGFVDLLHAHHPILPVQGSVVLRYNSGSYRHQRGAHMRARGLKVMGGAVVLAVGLTACGASVPTTHVGAPASGSAVKARVLPVRAISMNDVKDAVSGDRSVRVHTTVTLGVPGETTPSMETTITTDAANHRFAFTSAPLTIPSGTPSGDATKGSSPSHDPIDVPGYEVRGQTGPDHTDLYLRKAGDPTWTHLVVNKSLGDEISRFSDPSKQLEGSLPSDIPGITMKPEDTVTYKGETMSRQVATIDFAKMFDGIAPQSKAPSSTTPGATTDPLEGLKDGLGDLMSSGSMAAALPKGTIEVLVDHDGFPRKITTDLSVGGDKNALSTRSETTIDPLDASASIDLPSPAEVGRTVEVNSTDDLAAALDALEPLGKGMFGKN